MQIRFLGLLSYSVDMYLCRVEDELFLASAVALDFLSSFLHIFEDIGKALEINLLFILHAFSVTKKKFTFFVPSKFMRREKLLTHVYIQFHKLFYVSLVNLFLCERACTKMCSKSIY